MPAKFYDPIEYADQAIDQQYRFQEGYRAANILDPIHETLTPEVWDDPGAPKPKLKEQHRKWIMDTVVGVLKKNGYTHVEDWLSLVLTGSLTTYQYDKGSDVDVSLFVDADTFPEWSRAEMIGVMISNVDGTQLPGTHYPMQCFVVPPDVKREDLYKPGLRSGYDLKADEWITPPEHERSLDVKSQLPGFYAYALEQADKMEALLRYEPEKAKLLWHQIHERRRVDQKAGKGDYAQSNIVYKFLANRGLFDAISEATGEYIAKTAKAPRFTPIDPSHVRHRIDRKAVEVAARHMGIHAPVNVRQVGGVSGGYHGPDDQGTHQISVVGWLQPESASRQTWHELSHAKQWEEGERFGVGYHDAYEQGHDAYRNHPTEIEAAKWADRNPFPLALPVARTASEDAAKLIYKKFRPTVDHGKGPSGPELPWIYVPEHDTVYLGPPGAYHWDLINSSKALKGLYDPDDSWTAPPGFTPAGDMHVHGRMTWPDKKLAVIGGDDRGFLPRIADALDAPVPEEKPQDPNWDF
jgi:hypothetical protein